MQTFRFSKLAKNILLVLVFSTLIISQLNWGSSLARASTPPVEIRWFVGLGGGTDSGSIAAEQEVAADFNAAYPNIHLTLEVVPNASAREILRAEIANGDAPDLIGPVGWAGANAFYGQWLDLTGQITAQGFDTSIWDPALVATYHTAEGQIGLPFFIFPGGMFFLPALFDAAGLAYPPQHYGDQYEMPGGTMVPWNWDTVTQIARLLTKDNTGKNSTEAGFDASHIVQFGYSPQWQSIQSIGTFYGGASAIYAGSAGAWVAAIPASWKAAWQWYYDGMWGAHPFIPSGPVASSPVGTFLGGNVFNSGKAAMGLTQIWYTCCLNDLVNAGVDWQVGIQPKGSADGEVHGRVDADTFRIWKDSAHPAEAFQAMAYLVTTGADKLLPAYGGMPAIASKMNAFFAAKASQYPSVTQASWDVFKAGVAYPDTPSAEGWMPGDSILDNDRLGTFLNLLQFTPPGSLDFNNEFNQLQADLTVLFNTNFMIISGNAGRGGVNLDATDGYSATSISGGDYTVLVPSGWSGTITPSIPGGVFTPAFRNYTLVTTNKTDQDYSVLFKIFLPILLR